MKDELKLALSCFQQGELDKAKIILEKILLKNTGNAFAWFLSAIISLQQGKFEPAIASFKNAVKYQANYPEAFNNMGVAFEASNEIDEAVKSYKKAITQKTDYANAYYNLANIQKNKKEYDEAIDNYTKAIKYKPDYSNAMNNLALLYQSLGSFSKSESLLKRALTNNVADPEIENNLGYNYYRKNQYLKSSEIFHKILHAVPDYAPTLLNYGLLMKAMGHHSEARHYFSHLSRDPQFQMQALSNLAYLELSIENYEIGWQHYRHRPSTRKLTFKSPDSLPSDIQGKKILIYKDQGIGDELFLARYIPALINRGANLSYYTDKKLASFWHRTFSDLSILTSIPTLQDYELVISLGDLPYLLHHDNSFSIPSSVRISPDSTIVEKIQKLLPNNGKQNIAVTWESGTKGLNTLFKSFPPDKLGACLLTNEANILVIQRNPKTKDIKILEKNLGRKTFNYAFINDDLEEMLALLSLVDDYICVSNTNSHLMATLNRPFSVFIPHPPEWRWLYQGRQTPWFPLAKLYRQDATGSWEDAINQFKERVTEKITLA